MGVEIQDIVTVLSAPTAGMWMPVADGAVTKRISRTNFMGAGVAGGETWTGGKNSGDDTIVRSNVFGDGYLIVGDVAGKQTRVRIKSDTQSSLLISDTGATSARRELQHFMNDGSYLIRALSDDLNTELFRFLQFDHSNGDVIFNNTAKSTARLRVSGASMTHQLFVNPDSAAENIAFFATAAPNWQTMDRGIFMGDASTTPTGDPSGGGFLFSNAGALKWRGSSGTITTLGPA